MRHLLCFLGLAALATSAIGAEASKQELIVETDWKLTGTKIDQSEKPGEGVSKMTVSGDATVSKGQQVGKDTITITGKANVIEYHVIQKKFVLRGSPSASQLNAKGEGRIVSGTKPNSTIEIFAGNGLISAEGPNKVKWIDSNTPAKEKKK